MALSTIASICVRRFSSFSSSPAFLFVNNENDVYEKTTHNKFIDSGTYNIYMFVQFSE